MSLPTTLAELYQGVILDHNKAPRNRGPLPDATHQATVQNPLCGDVVTLRLRLSGDDGQEVLAACFEGEGCALSRAAASLLTLTVTGRPVAEALALGAELDRFLRRRDAGPPDEAERGRLGDLVALAGVRDFPSRLRCATLPWEALAAAVRDGGDLTGAGR